MIIPNAKLGFQAYFPTFTDAALTQSQGYTIPYTYLISVLKLTAATLLVPFMLELILTNGESGFTSSVSVLFSS